MPTVGDLIVRARNAANDPCQTLQAPVGPASVNAFGAGIFNGTVYFVLTYLTQWGETTPTPEESIACTNQGISLNGLTTPPVAALFMRMYFGYSSGAEQQYIQFAAVGGNLIVGLTASNPLVLTGVAPYKASSYLPDSDGDIVSASDIYRWINAGLVALGRRAGGILDQTGVAMPAGNAEVQIPGWWLRFLAVWHNGWLTLPEQQNYTWLQSPVTGIPGIVTLWRNGAAQVVGTWPQPSTPPAITILTANMGATDNVATVQNTADFHGTDGAISSTDPNANLTSNIGGFAGAMVGLAITVQGAGPAGGPLTTTVAQFVSPNQIQLVTRASTTVSGAVFDITNANSTLGFTAPGMCQIDNEIMSYSIVSLTQLTGLIRGYSGTIPSAHSSGALVTQLILRLLGRRMPVPVAVGQSANILDIPQGWEDRKSVV